MSNMSIRTSYDMQRRLVCEQLPALPHTGHTHVPIVSTLYTPSSSHSRSKAVNMLLSIKIICSVGHSVARLVKPRMSAGGQVGQ